MLASVFKSTHEVAQTRWHPGLGLLSYKLTLDQDFTECGSHAYSLEIHLLDYLGILAMAMGIALLTATSVHWTSSELSIKARHPRETIIII